MLVDMYLGSVWHHLQELLLYNLQMALYSHIIQVKDIKVCHSYYLLKIEILKTTDIKLLQLKSTLCYPVEKLVREYVLISEAFGEILPSDFHTVSFVHYAV